MFAFLLALAAGALTIGGPCILPLLPIILGANVSKSHPARPLFIVLGFILTFSASAILLGLFSAALGFRGDSLRTASAIIIAFFGLALLFPNIKEKIFSRVRFPRALTSDRMMNTSSVWSGFLLGSTLGIVWTPCAGPVLGTILTLIASRQQLIQSAALLIAYALGAGLPMLLIAYGGQAVATRMRSLAAYSETVERIFGAIILLTAFAMLTGLDRSVQTWLVLNVPWIFPNLSLNL